jgi:hypothetical protein
MSKRVAPISAATALLYETQASTQADAAAIGIILGRQYVNEKCLEKQSRGGNE